MRVFDDLLQYVARVLAALGVERLNQRLLHALGQLAAGLYQKRFDMFADVGDGDISHIDHPSMTLEKSMKII